MNQVIDVLIVEDDEADSRFLCNALRAFSPTLTLHVLTSGIEASEFLQDNRNKVRSVLLDVRLPGKSGLDILREIREHPDRTDMPVVVLTGVWSEIVHAQCRALGVLAHIEKSTHREQLEDVARRLVLHVVKDILGRSMAILASCKSYG